MKIIEIKNTTHGEVAYLFDEQNARVIKVLVEDMTPPVRVPVKRRPAYEELEYEEEKVTEVPRRRRIPTPQDDMDEQEEMPLPANQRSPMKKNIMPPGVASIFTPAGQQGEAVETRRV